MDNFNDIGRLTRDFEVKALNGGNKTTYVSTSAIAIQRDYKNKEGKYDVDFVDIQVWGEGFATKIAPNIKKGNRVHVTGRLQIDKYTAKDGSNRIAVKINCSGCKGLDYNNANNTNNANKNFTPKTEQFTPEFNEENNFNPDAFSPIDDDQDIPF